jgi:transposase
MDLNCGNVVFVGDDKNADALESFWKRLKQSKAKVEALSMNVSPTYTITVVNNLKDADIVFDHFHVIKLFNDKLSDFRRKFHSTLENTEKNVLKGSHWIFLKNTESIYLTKMTKTKA